jgi:hypothetical protein
LLLHVLPLQLLTKLASQRNQQPLPELRTRHGLRLPPEGECLLNPNYQLQPAPEGSRQAPPTDAAVEARRSSYNVQQAQGDARIQVAAPEVAWTPPPDAPAEPWPQAALQTPEDVEML